MNDSNQQKGYKREEEKPLILCKLNEELLYKDWLIVCAFNGTDTSMQIEITKDEIYISWKFLFTCLLAYLAKLNFDMFVEKQSKM